MTGFNTESLTWKAANWIHGLPDQCATTIDVMRKFQLTRIEATEVMNAIRKSGQLYTSKTEHLDNPTEGRRLTVTAIGTPGGRPHPFGQAGIARAQSRKDVSIGKMAMSLMPKPKR